MKVWLCCTMAKACKSPAIKTLQAYNCKNAFLFLMLIINSKKISVLVKFEGYAV